MYVYIYIYSVEGFRLAYKRTYYGSARGVLKERFGETSICSGVKTLVETQGHSFQVICLRVGVWNIAFGEHQAHVPKWPCTQGKRLYRLQERLQKAFPALQPQGKLPTILGHSDVEHITDFDKGGKTARFRRSVSVPMSVKPWKRSRRERD